jgi:hypothetical protein
MPDKVKVLYNALAGEYDLGSFDEFKNKMSDQTKRKALYDAAGKDYELGTFDEFNRKMSPAGPVATAQASIQGIPTFQEQVPTMQARASVTQVQPNRFDAPIAKDKKKSGSYIGALYDSFISAVDPLNYIQDEIFLGAYQQMSGKKLTPQEKEATRKFIDISMGVAGARPRKTQDEGFVEDIQGGWDMSDGFGSKDLKAIGLMGSRVVGDLAIATAGTMVGAPPGSTYFAQGYGSGMKDYNDMVSRGQLEENSVARQGYALTVGTINGLLEKYAFDKIFGKGPAFDAVKRKVTTEVLKQVAKSNTKVTMDVVEKVGEQMLKKELSGLSLRAIGRRGARVGYAAGVESITEGTQAGLEDAAKLLTNAIQGQQVFDEEDIKKNFLKNVLNSAAAGVVIGGPMGLASTMMSNVDNTIVKEIAKAKDETELNKILDELEESMVNSNASEEEVDAMRQSAVRYNNIKQTIPATVSDDAKSNIISLIDRRNGIDEKMSNWQAELEMVDESMKPDVEAEMNTLIDAKELINDEIRENATGGKFTYTENKGKYFKQFEGGDPIEIKKSTYELKKTIENATKKSEGPVQESSAVSDISQRQGTQEGGTQKAPAQADSRYRNISSEETVGIPTLLGSKVTYKVGNRKIVGTLIQEGQTLSVENEAGDVVAELGNIDELSSMSPEQMNLTVIESRVEPTENGFAVDGKELFNENDNPFDAVSVDKNGNVMNVVLTTTGGKRRKFRGRVAQDLAAQISQKEEQKAQQADQRLQQEFALPTPTAPKTITTQPTIARVTEDNVADLGNIQGTPLQKKVLNDAKRVITAIGAAVRNITGSPVSVNVHDQNSYTAAVLEAGGTEEDAKSRGFYMADDGSIHLNMDNIDSDTMLHEGFHPILDALEKFNPAVINDLFTQLESIPEAAEIIAKARRTYTGDVTQKKEAITDFVAAVADGRAVLNPTNFQKIKKFIQDMLQKLGIGQPNVSFMKVDNEQDLIKLANFVTEKFMTGETITLEGLEGTVEKQLDGIEKDLTGDKQYDSSEGVDIDGTVPEEGTGRGPQFSKSTLANARRNVKKISELVGLKISRVVFYDMTRVGKLSIKNIKTGYTPDVDGKGGPLYSYMDDSVDNQAVLAFVSINQAIQSLQRQQMFPDAAHAVASQNPLTAHLGNKSTLRALFGDGVGIFQKAAKTKAQEKEIVNVLLSEIDRMSKLPEGNEAKKSLDKILPKVDLKSIKTINDFRDKILLGEGDSFGKRGSILGELLQNKQSKVTAATRDAHKILHYKYGIPTIEDIAKGNNQEELGNVELGDVVKFVRPSTEPVIYTTDPAMYEMYSKKPTPAMKEGGIRIELLPEASSHESYPFVLVGENIALLEEYVGAQQLYEKYKDMKKSATFFKLGRMKKDAEAGQVAAETPTEAKGPAFQRVAPNGKPSKLNAKQYEQVRTAEFKNWFGDWENDPANASKVVDDNGEPLVVYHGSPATDIDIFDRGRSIRESSGLKELGTYFTNNKSLAELYSKAPKNSEYKKFVQSQIDKLSDKLDKSRSNREFESTQAEIDRLSDNSGKVYPVFLNMRNIKEFDADKKFGVEAWNNLTVDAGYKIARNRDAMDFLKEGKFGVEKVDGVIGRNIADLSVYTSNKDVQSETFGKYGGDVFLLFDGNPNAIKSATENVGTFSTQDDRIQFQKVTPTKETRKPVKVAGTTVISSEKKADIQHLFSAGTPLGPAIRTFKEQMGGELTAEVRTAEKLTNEAMKLIQKYKGIITTQDIENFLSAKQTSGMLPLDLASKLSEMRTHIDKLTDRIIDLGVIEDKETRQLYLNNKGRYMLRSYELFTVKDGPVTVENVVKKLKNVDQAKLDAALKFLEDEIRKDSPRLTDAQVKEEAISQANRHLSDEDMKFGGRPIEGAVNTKSITRRSEYLEESPAIRALMGEFTDPVYKYYSSIFKLANITSHRQYLNKLKEEGMGKFFFTESTGEATVQIDPKKTKGLRPIGDLYTFPEIKKALTIVEEEKANAYMQIAGILRKSKTVYNPATHVGNILGSMAFSIVNGHWMYIGKTFSYIKKGNSQKLSGLLDILRREGVLNNNVGIGEIKQYFNKFEDVESMLASINDTSKKYTASGTYGKTKKFLNKIPAGMEKLYAWEDDIFKILGFVNEANLYARAEYRKDFDALNPDERAEIIKGAAERVKSFYPTFSRVPKFVKKLSKVYALGDFLSFPVESVRTSYNTLAQAWKEVKSKNPRIVAIGVNRIAGTLLYNGMIRGIEIYSLMALGQGLSGMVGYLFDDEEEIKKRNYAKQYKADWNKESVDIRTQFSDGKLVYVDIGARDPYKYQREIWNTFWSNMSDKEGFFKSMAKTLAKAVIPFISPDMAATTFLNLLNNKDEFGEKIVNPENPSFKSNAMDVGGYVLKRVSPGAVSSMYKMYNMHNQGDSEGIKAEGLNQFVRTYEVDLEKAFTRYVYASPGAKNTGDTGFKERLDIAEDIYREVKNSKYVSDAEKEQRYQMALEGYKNVLRDVRGYYEAAKAGGIDAAKLDAILQRAKIGNSRNSGVELVSIMQNRYDFPDEIYIRR